MKIVCDHHILKLKFNDGVARSIRLEMIYFPNQEEMKETIVYDLLNPTMYMCHVQLVLANYYWCILGLFAWCPGKAAWPRQRAQASDFGGLGSGSLPGQRAAWQGCIQTSPA